MQPEPFIALTDADWFAFLAANAVNGRVDEVNFWSPATDKPLKHMSAGEPVFFRIGGANKAIAGFGFFAHFTRLDVATAWSCFGSKNGCADLIALSAKIGAFRIRSVELRALDALDPRVLAAPMGCTILRDATFWPPSRWIPWGVDRGWSPGIMRGKTEHDPARIEILLDALLRDSPTEPEEFTAQFEPLDVDERQIAIAETRMRVGQGAFRARLLDVYGRRCAISGERTEPVLDAAHIQSYLGPRSNHVQNGLVLTKEFHALFDAGYVTVTPDHVVRVSDRIRERWSNGKRYYEFHERPLRVVPNDPKLQPSPAALEWHARRRFVG